MVRPEVALDTNAELMHRNCLPKGWILLLDNLAQRVFEGGKILPGTPHKVGCQLAVECAEVVQVKHQPLILPADQSMDLLHVPLLVEEVEEDALLLLVFHRAEVSAQQHEKHTCLCRRRAPGWRGGR